MVERNSLPDTGRMQGEIIGDVDTRRLMIDTLRVPFRWIVSLDVRFADPAPARCSSGLCRGTGTLIGSRYVLTAAHVLSPDGRRQPERVEVIPARNGRREPLGRYRARAWHIPRLFAGQQGVNRNYDFALVELTVDLANRKFDALGGRALGCWGHPDLGAGTRLIRIDPAYLRGKRVNVAGYPGDRCGSQVYNTRTGCPEEDHATTLWLADDTIEVADERIRLIYHRVDTASGQSGAPVWLYLPSTGRRCLVGVHASETIAHRDGQQVRPSANVAVRVTRELLRTLRTWM